MPLYCILKYAAKSYKKGKGYLLIANSLSSGWQTDALWFLLRIFGVRWLNCPWRTEKWKRHKSHACFLAVAKWCKFKTKPNFINLFFDKETNADILCSLIIFYIVLVYVRSNGLMRSMECRLNLSYVNFSVVIASFWTNEEIAGPLAPLIEFR